MDNFKALSKNKSYMKNRYLDVQLSKGENAKTFGFLNFASTFY